MRLHISGKSKCRNWVNLYFIAASLYFGVLSFRLGKTHSTLARTRLSFQYNLCGIPVNSSTLTRYPQSSMNLCLL